MLIKQNERFIISIARQYAGQGLDLDDLVQEGKIGLIVAIDRFDPNMGSKFLTYASWWIKQAILQALSEHNRQVRLPANRISILEQYKKVKGKLTQDKEREPSREEVMETMGIERHDLVEQSSVSYHSSKNDEDENGTMLDILANDTPMPDAALMEESYKRGIRMILNKLSKRERIIVKMSFGIDLERSYTLEEIGEKLGLTRERIRQIRDKAILRLKRLNRYKRFEFIKD